MTTQGDLLEGPQPSQPSVAETDCSPHTGNPRSRSNSIANQHQVQPALQHVAQEVPLVINPPNGSVDHITDPAPDITTHPILTSSHQDVQRRLNEKTNEPSSTTAIHGTPTKLPAEVADDIAPVENSTKGMVPFPGLEEDQQAQNGSQSYWQLAPNNSELVDPPLQHTAQSIAESEEHQIQAFAKLEFDDGEFYMNTYAVELGRDIQIARHAFERDLEALPATDPRSRKPSASSGGGSVAFDNIRQENGHRVSRSIVSESGGIVGIDTVEDAPLKRSRRKKSKSSSSSSRRLSSRSSIPIPIQKTDYNALAMASLGDSSQRLNELGSERPVPSPEVTPLIPIHPPTTAEGAATGHKSISRKHIRIAYNFEENLFQVEILGRNGGFVDDEWYAPGDVQPLFNQSNIQIGGVSIRFVLPDVQEGETAEEEELALDINPPSGVNFDMGESSEPDSIDDEVQDNALDELNVKNEKVARVQEPGMAKKETKVKSKPEPTPPLAPKRKGPGRPPKNGVISKREQALIARKAKEDAKAAGERGRGKGGKDTAGPGRENSYLQPSGKRKYTKRKRTEDKPEDQQEVRESTEHTDSVPPEQAHAASIPLKLAKEKKPPKPPRTPSPIYDMSTMTEEQLAKPNSSYVVLIHEALSNSTSGKMGLPQIYRAIERRYPYYKLRVTTMGWQSSVRHNLSQHPAFRKEERDGKGWKWGLVPEVSIEKEKRKRATPPPPPQALQQHYYPQGPQQGPLHGPSPELQHPYPYAGVHPPNGHLPYAIRPSIPEARPPPPGLNGFPLPLKPPQSEATYQSPYQSTPPSQPPPPTPEPQQLKNSNGTNGSYPTPPSQSIYTQPSDGNSHSLAPSQGQSPTSPSHPRQAQVLPTPAKEPNKNDNNCSALEVSQAIKKFKNALIDSMDDKERAERLVTSAINRVLGLSNSLSILGDDPEDAEEKAIVKALENMLSDLSKKTQEAKRQDSTSVPSNSVLSPTHGTNGASRPLPEQPKTAASIAADIAAKISQSNGDHTASNDVAVATETKRGLKRHFEEGNLVDGNDWGRPEAKRVAME